MRAVGICGIVLGFTIVVFATQTTSAAEPHIGRWAIDPSGCRIDGDTSATAPLVVTDKSVKWFVANCSIKKIYKAADSIYIQARCENEGGMHTIPISLTPRGDRLTVVWDKARVPEFRRCR
ncbi:MAG: hypothetical protein HY659_11340 [Rhizobiales bacterium]|nr:hypothetical protein [Hyphomicrobiales bacterium]